MRPHITASRKADNMTYNLSIKMVAAFVSVVTVISFLTFGSSDAKPRPQDNGREYCITNNDDPENVVTYGRGNSCCYWEGAGDGEFLQVCLECDKNWKNCKETLGSRVNQAPRPNTSGEVGTEAPSGRSPSRQTAPRIKLKTQ